MKNINFALFIYLFTQNHVEDTNEKLEVRHWKRLWGIRALKKELKKQGFNVDYPPNMSTMEYEIGAEIWVPILEGTPAENFNKICAIVEKIAEQRGLIGIGSGPVLLENALYFLCCGFRRKP